MSRWRILVFAAAIALSAAPARSDELGPAMPSTPAAIETSPPAAPIVVRQPDAETLLRNVPSRTDAPPTPTPDGTREFTADEPPKPVVNPTSRFVFMDETKRPAAPVKSLADRQAAVEAVRRSVRTTGGAE